MKSFKAYLQETEAFDVSINDVNQALGGIPNLHIEKFTPTTIQRIPVIQVDCEIVTRSRFTRDVTARRNKRKILILKDPTDGQYVFMDHTKALRFPTKQELLSGLKQYVGTL